MDLLFEYLKQRWRVAAVFALFCAIFAITFVFYRLPLRAVGYPASLCAVVGLAITAFDFLRVLRKHRALERIRTTLDVDTERFPAATSITERDHQTIIRLLVREQAELRAQTNKRYDDMVDHYTIWAHQIKTPIAAMRLTLQNEDTPLSRRLQSDLLRIEQYVEMALMLLRLDSPSRDYVIQEYELDLIVRQAVKKFAGEFIDRRIQLVYEPLHTTVLTDEKWLSFVVEQVLSNALKYTPAGSVTITLEGPGTLCIQDTGMGIAAEDLPRIFEKGYTGYHGRADKKASGIGLYLCRRICTDLGHTITAQSAPDQGTVIRLDLSRADLEVE